MDNFRRRVDGERQKTVIDTYLSINALEFTFDFEFNVPYQIHSNGSQVVGDVFQVSAPHYLLQKHVVYDDYSDEVIDELYVNNTVRYLYDGLHIDYRLIGGRPYIDAELSYAYVHFDEDTINYAKSIFPGVDGIGTADRFSWNSNIYNTGRQTLSFNGGEWNYNVKITPSVQLVFDRQTDTIWFQTTNT